MEIFKKVKHFNSMPLKTWFPWQYHYTSVRIQPSVRRQICLHVPNLRGCLFSEVSIYPWSSFFLSIHLSVVIFFLKYPFNVCFCSVRRLKNSESTQDLLQTRKLNERRVSLDSNDNQFIEPIDLEDHVSAHVNSTMVTGE